MRSSPAMKMTEANLHSTMLLLKSYRKRFKYYAESIYIPLCFYLNAVMLYFTGGLVLIYIPLCFYLNNSEADLLFFLVDIYIPLCFYLNSEYPL